MSIEDINILIETAIVEIEDAFRKGDGERYGKLAKQYGPVAHRVYRYLDPKSGEQDFFHKPSTAVLIDPMTVCNRARSLYVEGSDLTPLHEEFWHHCDLIKSLVDYLELNKFRRKHASA